MTGKPAGSSRTHHVALVHDDRVWATGGVLPTFVHDRDDDDAPDPTRTAAQLVAEGVHAAPPVLLGEDDGATVQDRLHVLVLRGDPTSVTGGEWVPVALRAMGRAERSPRKINSCGRSPWCRAR